MRYVVGLTGATGSGKSTIAQVLGEMGAQVLDADAVARRLQQPGEAGALAIRREFGIEYFSADGSLDRAKLAGLVFNDAAQLERLNSVMFPLITEVMEGMLQKLDGVCIIDAAVLFEAGADALCDYTILAIADENVRLRRIMERDGIGEKQARERMRAQNTMHKCDLVLDTTHGVAALVGQLAGFMAAVKRLVNRDKP